MLTQLTLVVLIQVTVLILVGAYSFTWRLVGLAETEAFLKAALCSSTLLVLVLWLWLPKHSVLRVPFPVIVVDTILAFGGMIGWRVAHRALYERNENRSFSQLLNSSVETIAQRLESRKFLILSGWTIVYFAITCTLASQKLIWDDEFFTLYISKADKFSGIWSALLTGADQHPPFFYWVSRAFFSVFGVNHLSFRLPAILGFWVMSLCLFRFVSKRTSALYGLIAMLLPFISGAYWYAYEGRGYGLVLGFSGVAMVCWQSATEGRHRRRLAILGLAISLAAAVSSHYYAILLLLPFTLGEIVRTISTRRFDVPIWLAFVSPALPLLLFFPIIRSARTYSGSFWGKPSWNYWNQALGSFESLLWPALVPLIVMTVALALYFQLRLQPLDSQDRFFHVKLPYHETATAIGLVALPITCMILAKLVTNGYHQRYHLPVVIGVSVLLSHVAYSVFKGRAILGAFLALLLLVWFGFSATQAFWNYKGELNALYNTSRFLQEQNVDGLPIVVSEITQFHKLSFYAHRDLAQRLVYVADPESSVRYIGHDTVDRGLLDLKPWFPLNVVDYHSYIASEPQFLVFGYIGSWTWLTYELLREDLKIELVGREGYRVLFRVSHNRYDLTHQDSGVEDNFSNENSIERSANDADIYGKRSLCSEWMNDKICTIIR
jgi:hypothetical protein